MSLASGLNNWTAERSTLNSEAALENLYKIFGSRRTEVLYYFTLVHQAFHATSQPPVPLADHSTPPEQLAAHPYSVLKEEDLKKIPVQNLEELKVHTELFKKSARTCSVTVQRLQAGTGSSFSRRRYLSHLLKIPEAEVQQSAKGVDLFVPLESLPFKAEAPVSIAELQLLQEITLQEGGAFRVLRHQDLVGPETQRGLSQIWKKNLPQQAVSYDSVFQSRKGLGRRKPLLQQAMPTLEEGASFSLERLAPAGHGLFGFQALMELLEHQPEPASFIVISNGEDLNGLPPPEIFGWMREHKIPLTMITTEKTPLDLKGGQIALCKQKGGAEHVAIVEKAQADHFGQTDYFQKLGLRPGDRPALFNTNTAILQTDLLKEKLTRLSEQLSPLELALSLAPELIRNVKTQNEKQFTQLEGAMGSVYLNLDRLARDTWGEPLVHFLQIPAQERTDFFTPIKTAFDFFQLYHADKFFIDKTLRLKKHPGAPLASFETLTPEAAQHYSDLQNLLTDFQGAHIRRLQKLKVSRPQSLRLQVLAGDVSF